MSAARPLLIITGPTAVGKTALSIQAAKALNGEVVSADSMQVYRHMDIGSAKITPENYSARIKSITVRVCITNCTGILYITDILLQAGAVATGWVGHPCEMKWTLDG